MKNNLIILLCCLLVSLIPTSVLANDVGLSYLGAGSSGTQDVRLTTANIINTGFLLIGIIFVIIVMISGAFYLFSQNDPEKKAKAKKIVISGIIGLLIVLLAFSITTFILNALGITLKPMLRGDIDADGYVQSGDISIMQSYLNGNDVKCEDQYGNTINCVTVMDLSGNGVVGPEDLTILQQIVAGNL